MLYFSLLHDDFIMKCLTVPQEHLKSSNVASIYFLALIPRHTYIEFFTVCSESVPLLRTHDKMLIFVARSHHTDLWTSKTCVANLQTKFSGFISMCDFVSGWVGGCCGLILGHPFDTLKVRQQALGRYPHAVNNKITI
jgi:hypothetical protein